MKSVIRKLRRQTGTSLLEVLIALAITGVVTTAVFKAYVAQHRHYIVQEDVTDIQQNARAAIDEISRHIRMAGYDLPGNMAAIGMSNTNPDTIVLTFRIDGCDTYLSSNMSQPSSDFECATDVSCFQNGQWIYIYEAASDTGQWVEITTVDAGMNRLQHTMSLSRTYSIDSEVLAVTRAKFYVDTSDADHPNLMVQYVGQAPQVYATNISDLQFQYHMKNGMIIDEPVLIDEIREVLVSITGRSNSPDPEAQDTANVYRSRDFATSIHLRNLGS